MKCNATMISGLHGAKPPTEAHHSRSQDSGLPNLQLIPVNSMTLCKQDTLNHFEIGHLCVKLIFTHFLHFQVVFRTCFSRCIVFTDRFRTCSVIDACAWANKTTMKLGNPNRTVKRCGYFTWTLCIFMYLYVSLCIFIYLYAFQWH